MEKQRVLFLCTGNSARSQMAEAFLRHHAGDRFEAFSAGLDPQGINPFTLKVMQEKGIDMAGQYSKDVKEYLGKLHFSTVVTVCSNAEKSCPSIFPGTGNILNWSFDDPAAAEGSEAEITEIFRHIRDQIDQHIQQWLDRQTGDTA